jgi:hypothetical protein
VFKLDNTVINLLKIPAARDLIGPGTVAEPEAGSRFQFTIGVDDGNARASFESGAWQVRDGLHSDEPFP